MQLFGHTIPLPIIVLGLPPLLPLGHHRFGHLLEAIGALPLPYQFPTLGVGGQLVDVGVMNPEFAVVVGHQLDFAPRVEVDQIVHIEPR